MSQTTVKNPLLLTLTKYGMNGEQVTMAHPNTLEGFGTLRRGGHRGLQVIFRHKDETWVAIRANNTDFFKAYDENKKALGIWFTHREGEKWYDSSTWKKVWELLWI